MAPFHKYIYDIFVRNRMKEQPITSSQSITPLTYVPPSPTLIVGKIYIGVYNHKLYLCEGIRENGGYWMKSLESGMTYASYDSDAWKLKPEETMPLIVGKTYRGRVNGQFYLCEKRSEDGTFYMKSLSSGLSADINQVSGSEGLWDESTSMLTNMEVGRKYTLGDSLITFTCEFITSVGDPVVTYKDGNIQVSKVIYKDRISQYERIKDTKKGWTILHRDNDGRVFSSYTYPTRQEAIDNNRSAYHILDVIELTWKE